MGQKIKPKQCYTLYGVEALIITCRSSGFYMISSIQTIVLFYHRNNGFGEKYEFGNAQMFVIDGIAKVRDIIERTERKIANIKSYLITVL